jgi:hypothetical protein
VKLASQHRRYDILFHACTLDIELERSPRFVARPDAGPKLDNRLHQLQPIVLHVADLGADVPRLDRADVGYINAAN